MFPTPYFEIVSLLTEVSLRLSPSVIKGIDINVETATLVKILVYLCIALSISTPKDISRITEFSFDNISHYILLGTLSFVATTLTYFGYKELPLQTSMIISSSFPILLIIIYQFLGIEQPVIYIPFFLIAYFLMVYFLRPKPHHIEKFSQMNIEKKHTKYKAVGALILGSLIGCTSLALRKLGYDTHETSTIRTNLGALILSASYFTVSKQLPEFKAELLIKLILFNIFIGYVVSKIRSIAFETVPEVYYGIFVFVGTIIAFNITEIVPYFNISDSFDFKLENIEEKKETKDK